MFVRAYLRASTEDQDAARARAALEDFMADRGRPIAAYYIENASGRTTDRPELRRLLNDSREGDVLLVESVDRLSRLPAKEWRTLRRDIEARGIRVVAQDLPSTHTVLSHPEGPGDEMTSRVLSAVNSMLLEVVAAQAEADYLQRRQRQAQGIERAKAERKYKGRPLNRALHNRIIALRTAGHSIRATAQLAGTSPTTVQRAQKRHTKETLERVDAREAEKQATA